MKRWAGLLLTLAAFNAHAATISGLMIFDVLTQADDYGSGYLILDRSRLVDFEFSMFGFTFTEADMDPLCQCSIVPVSGGSTFDIALDGVFGLLVWDFAHGNFGAQFNYGGSVFGGTSDGGEVSSLVLYDLWTVPVSEPGTVGMLLAAFAFLLTLIRKADGR